MPILLKWKQERLVGGAAMKIDNGISAQPKVNQQCAHTPTSQITGPLLGLGYIIALPFAGLVSTFFLIGYRVKQLIVAVGRRAVQTIARA